LKCNYPGEVGWKIPNGELSNVLINNTILNIENVQRKNEGHYECFVNSYYYPSLYMKQLDRPQFKMYQTVFRAKSILSVLGEYL